MNKGELVASIAKQTGMTKADSQRALDAMIDAVEGTLASGNKVTIPGFGTFSTSRRSARKGRNPQTGEEIQIKAKTVAKFKAGKGLAEAVN